MHKEFKILEIRRNQVLAQPLDAVKTEVLKIAGASKYIENEIIVAQPLSVGIGVASRWEVIACRVDPTFLDCEVPKLMSSDLEDDDGGELEFEFVRKVEYERHMDFEDALDALESGDYDFAASLFRACIMESPNDIDAYHHLGYIETDLGHRHRALKYFQMGYRIGLRSIPEFFLGRLPWNRLPNRPFLRAAHGYGLALEQNGRHLEAVDVYEQVLALNPNDNQGIRFLLPSLYVRAQAPGKARAVLEQHGADGMNVFTRCLLEVEDGHRLEALRWLCRGLSYNLHVPALVLAGKIEPLSDEALGVAMGSEYEATQYVLTNDRWLRKTSREFLSRLMAAKPFVRRLDRAFEIQAALDRDSFSPGRAAKVDELYAIFDEDHIPKILEECRSYL